MYCIASTWTQQSEIRYTTTFASQPVFLWGGNNKVVRRPDEKRRGVTGGRTEGERQGADHFRSPLSHEAVALLHCSSLALFDSLTSASPPPRPASPRLPQQPAAPRHATPRNAAPRARLRGVVHRCESFSFVWHGAV